MESCKEKFLPDQEPIVNLLKRLLCFDKKENNNCFITDEKKKTRLEGKCCQNMCYFGVRDCEEVSSGIEATDKPRDQEQGIDDLQKKIELLSCLGIPRRRQLPDT